MRSRCGCPHRRGRLGGAEVLLELGRRRDAGALLAGLLAGLGAALARLAAVFARVCASRWLAIAAADEWRVCCCEVTRACAAASVEALAVEALAVEALAVEALGAAVEVGAGPRGRALRALSLGVTAGVGGGLRLAFRRCGPGHLRVQHLGERCGGRSPTLTRWTSE